MRNVLLVVALMLLVPAIAEAKKPPAVPPQGTWLRIINSGSALSLIVKDESHDDGAQVVQGHGKVKIDATNWKIEAAGEFFKIKNKGSSKYLALSKEKDNAGKLCQMPESKDTTWKIEPCDKGYWRISSPSSDQCLCVHGRGPAVEQCPPQRHDSEQHWVLEEVR